MKDFQERNNVNRALFSFPVMVGVLFFAVFAAWGTMNVLRTQSSLDTEIIRLKAEIAKAEAARKEYDLQTSAAQTSEGADREARERFNLKKPGEDVVLFVDDNKKTSAPPESNVAGTYHAIQKWFENIFPW